MGGCFGPRRNRTLVYIDLLEQIYSESAMIEVPGANVESYDIVRDKLTKKGLLKKLVEHLSSHRNFLNDCIQNNYRKMKDSASSKAHITGLLISNTLVNNLQEFQVKNLAPRISTPKPINIHTPHHPETSNQVFETAVDFRFENVYFQQALDLYDLEHTLRQRILDGLSTFAIKKQGNFTCDPLVCDVQRRLLQEIKINNNRDKCCITFSLMLAKENENIQTLQISEDVLRTFLHVWLMQGEKAVQIACMRVLQTYISRCLTSRQYWYIYTVLFEIYDMNHFIERSMIPLQAKVVEVLGNQDMRMQFLKGMLKHLLTYLSVCSDLDILTVRWELGVFEMPHQTLRTRYPNILSPVNKQNGFIALRRWIENGYLNIYELITFNKSSLISCFILNILCYHRDLPLLNAMISVFLRICQISDIHCTCVIFMVLLEEIFRIKLKTIQPGSILIRLACVCMQNYRLMEYINPEDYELIFKGIQTTIPHRTRLQILYLYGVMIEHSSTPFLTQLLQAIIKMVHSVFDNFCIKQGLLEKYMLVTSVYAIMRKLYIKGQEQIVMVFTKRLQNHYEDPHYSKQQKYLEKYLAYQLLEMLERRHYVTPTMKMINKLILLRDQQRAFYQIQKYMKENSILSTSRDSEHVFQRKSIERRYQFVSRQFDRYSSLGRQQHANIQPQFLIVKQRNSVMGSENFRQDDDSLHNIVELLKETGQTDYMNGATFAKSRIQGSQMIKK